MLDYKISLLFWLRFGCLLLAQKPRYVRRVAIFDTNVKKKTLRLKEFRHTGNNVELKHNGDLWRNTVWIFCLRNWNQNVVLFYVLDIQKPIL